MNARDELLLAMAYTMITLLSDNYPARAEAAGVLQRAITNFSIEMETEKAIERAELNNE